MNIHLPAILMFTRGDMVLTHCHMGFLDGVYPTMGKLKLTRLEWGVTPFFGQTQLRQLRLGKVLVDRRKDTDIMAMFKPSGWATCSTPQWEGGVPCFKSFAWNQCIKGCWNPWFPSIFECGWLPEIGHPRIQSFFGSSPPNFPQVGEKNMSKSHTFIQSKPGDTMEIQWIAQIWQCVKPCTPGEHQNSWQMDVHPIKIVLIGIDPYPNISWQ